jgi:hypothetical protein
VASVAVACKQSSATTGTLTQLKIQILALELEITDQHCICTTRTAFLQKSLLLENDWKGQLQLRL